MKYDDASWHYEGDYPADLPDENAATHIGMFVAWCIASDLMSDEAKEDFAEDMAAVKARQMTGRDYLITNCDEKFYSGDLSEQGNQFAKDYYDGEKSKFVKKYAEYMQDYCDIFNEKAEKAGFEYASVYHVENSWENYELVAKMLDGRFAQWKVMNYIQ